MNKFRFTFEQRFAIWRVYSKKCFHCEQPVTFKEVTIDHIIPEHILAEPEKLQAIKIEYGLGADFSINDYCNWVPAHFHCNRNKGGDIYRRTPALITILKRVRRKGEQARKEEARIDKNSKSDDALATLKVKLDKGIVSKDAVADLLSSIPTQRDQYEPIVVTFSLNTDEVLRKGSQIANLPRDYPSLYDWLEKELIKQLSSLLSCPFYSPEPSERSGETISVRLAFLLLDLNELDRFTIPWWEIVEIQYYSEVYGSAEWDRLRYKGKMQQAPIISDSEFIELLIRGGILMGFRQIMDTDYRAIALSADYVVYQSDSYYDLDMWREILESANIEAWEIEQALAKADLD